MDHRRSRGAYLATGLALCANLLAAVPANAELLAYSALRVGRGTGATLFNEEQSDTTTTGSGVQSGLAYDDGIASPAVGAFAEYGRLRAGSRGESANKGSFALQVETLRANATAQFIDVIVPVAASVAPGTPLLADFEVELTAFLGYGTQGVSNSSAMVGSGMVGLGLQLGSSLLIAQYHGQYDILAPDPGKFSVERRDAITGARSGLVLVSPADTLDGFGIAETLTLTTTVVSGSPVTLRTRLDTAASALARSIGDELSFDAQAGNTVRWGGITNVRLVNGAPVTGFTAIGNLSGLDFAKPVPIPLPAAGWLLCGGIATVLPLVRRAAAAPVRNPATRSAQA